MVEIFVRTTKSFKTTCPAVTWWHQRGTQAHFVTAAVELLVGKESNSCWKKSWNMMRTRVAQQAQATLLQKQNKYTKKNIFKFEWTRLTKMLSWWFLAILSISHPFFCHARDQIQRDKWCWCNSPASQSPHFSVSRNALHLISWKISRSLHHGDDQCVCVRSAVQRGLMQIHWLKRLCFHKVFIQFHWFKKT